MSDVATPKIVFYLIVYLFIVLVFNYNIMANLIFWLFPVFFHMKVKQCKLIQKAVVQS